MMKNLLSIVLALVTTISFAQTFVSTTPENKNVVLEEYTGIYCVWCPAGHVIGSQMHAANPNDVFLINVHTGGFATPNGPSDPNFNSDFGNQLATVANVSGYPTGSVNRRVFPVNPGGTAMSRSDWAASAQTVLAEPSPVNIGAQASYDMSTGILTVDVETYYTQTVTNTNVLHIAVVQNNMPGPQTGAVSNGDPASIISGPWSPTYNHQHVLRHFMTGAIGLEYNVTTAGTFVPQQLTWNIPTPFTISGGGAGYVPDIDPTNLAIIAYIDEGGSNVLTGTETAVVPIFPNAFDANVTASSAADVMCSSEADIDITFRNYGNQPLTSLDLNYDINGGTPATYSWTGNLASGGQETVTINNVSFNPLADSFGNPGNTVSWNATNPNGQIDQNTTNNSSISKFSHKDMSGDVLQGISAGNINIDLFTDGYGSETSWEIVAEDGTILGSGGPYASNTTYNIDVAVPGNMCFEFILYDSYGDGMCCANGVGTCLVTDANGNVIFEGDPVNLQNFSEIPTAFSTGASTGAAWECSPFGCVEGTPGLGIYMSESQCESDPTTGCYVGPTWSCDPVQGCLDVGTAGLGTYNTEQECIDDATSSPCNGSTAINENSENKFELFPNPAQDVLNIEGNFKSIEIYDVFGKLVLASDNKSEVNISSLANGSYYVNILTQDAVIKRKVTVTK
jgi:hypothetical protein